MAITCTFVGVKAIENDDRDVVVPAASGTKIFSDDHSDGEEADSCLRGQMGFYLVTALPSSQMSSPLSGPSIC